METKCSNRCLSRHIMPHHSAFSDLNVELHILIQMGWGETGILPSSQLPQEFWGFWSSDHPMGSKGLQNVQSPLREYDAFVYILLPSLLLTCYHVLCEKVLQSILETATVQTLSSYQTAVEVCGLKSTI